MIRTASDLRRYTEAATTRIANVSVSAILRTDHETAWTTT